VLADPTSDQLGKYCGKVRRNLVCVKWGCRWEYRAEFDSGRNLFPNRVLYLGRIIKNGAVTSKGFLTDESRFHMSGGTTFLRKAYSNPTQLSD
ncbi:MAG: hypothetical protein ABH840_01905, partial [Nanoarchaeota archaeon]